MPKWYEVPIEKERDAILQKREEWFPKAELNDWATLKALFNLIDLKKHSNQILMRDAVSYFPSHTTGEVKRFCEKFSPNIISLSNDKHHIDITYFGYRILVDETFKDLRETRYWFPYLDRILLENQDEQKTQTEYQVEKLINLLSEIESFKEFEERRKISKNYLPNTVRQPHIDSFVISEIANYHMGLKGEAIISLHKGQIFGVDPQEWYDQFFINHFSHLEQITNIAKSRTQQELEIKKIGKIFVSCGQY